MTSANEGLFDRARMVIPGGVNSPVRSFRSVGGTPYFVVTADGPYVWDADGRRYIDYVQSYGPSILGHAHPGVVDAVNRAAADGTSYGAPTEAEIRLAETVVERVEGLEALRFVNSGTEATMTALRLARGATGRDRVVIFAGCYHGHADALLAAGGSGVADQGFPAATASPTGPLQTPLSPHTTRFQNSTTRSPRWLSNRWQPIWAWSPRPMASWTAYAGPVMPPEPCWSSTR